MSAVSGLSGLSGLSSIFSGGFAPDDLAGLDLWMDAGRNVGSGGARSFSASDKATFQIADNADLSTGTIASFTWSCWFKVNDVSGSKHIISKWNPTNEYLLILIGSTLYWFVGHTPNGSTNITHAGIETDRWYHVICGYNSVTDEIFIQVDDGTESTADFAGNTPLDSTSTFSVGGRSDLDDFIDGSLSKIGFWKKLLSTAERTSIYNSGNGKLRAELSSSEATSLVSYWNCNEDLATDGLIDSEGSNDLSITAAELVSNGDFASDTVWSKGTGWTIAAGVASSDGTQAGDSDLSQSITLRDGSTYSTSFTVSGYTAGNVTMTCGGQEGTDRAANGTHTESIVASTADTGLIRADLNFVGSVDDVSIVATEIAVALGPRAVTAADSSGNDNHGALESSMTIDDWVADVPANTAASVYSLNFDGVDDHVLIDNAYDLGTTGSVSLWFKSTSPTNPTETIFASFASGTSRTIIQQSSSEIIAGLWEGSYDIKSAAMSDTNWHHLAMVRSGSSTTAYLDGVEMTGSTTPLVGLDTGKTYIGWESTAGRYFTGNISDVRVYDDALTTDEITWLRTKGVSGTDPTNTNLTANWPLDDGPQSVTAIGDGDTVLSWRSREGNNRLFQQTTASKRPTYVASAINGKPAIDFDGTDDLLVAASAFLTSSQGSIFIVFNSDGSASSQTPFSSSDEASGTDYMFCRYTSSEIWQIIVTGSTRGGSTTMINGSPNIVSATNNGSSIDLRVNGADETETGSHTKWFDDMAGPDNVAIGAWKNTAEEQHFNGKIAEIIVYNTALSSTDIAQVESYLANKYGVTLS